MEDSLAAYEQTARREHQEMLKRKQMIEKRKEHLENLNIKKVKIVNSSIKVLRLQALDSFYWIASKENITRKKHRFDKI